MNILVIGLGSMGRRRIRCIQALNIQNVRGFDLRRDRCEQATKEYSINTHHEFDSAIRDFHPDAVIISVPPDKHIVYIEWAIANRVHMFIEASVLDDRLGAAQEKLKGSGVVCAPSCTLRFHPAIKLIHKIILDGELGKLSNILLHSGQYLPDWHSYETVSEYYVSNPETGGGREIVPFEFSWFLNTFGWPRRVAGNYRKTINIDGAEYIDDTYNCLLDYGSYLAVVTVDVVSRYATRKLTVNGSKKQLTWSWDKNCIEVFDPEKNEWDRRDYGTVQSADGYNVNIPEQMYIDEIKSFIDAIIGELAFPNDLENDRKVLDLLYRIERSDRLSTFVDVV